MGLEKSFLGFLLQMFLIFNWALGFEGDVTCARKLSCEARFSFGRATWGVKTEPYFLTRPIRQRSSLKGCEDRTGIDHSRRCQFNPRYIQYSSARVTWERMGANGLLDDISQWIDQITGIHGSFGVSHKRSRSMNPECESIIYEIKTGSSGSRWF